MGFKLKLLLTENQSALGNAIYRGLEDHPYTVLCPPDDFNWHDLEAVTQLIDEHHPSLLINTLAYIGFDVTCNQILAQVCGHQMACVHLSSYQVFGNTYSGAEGRDESAIPAPQDEDGQRWLAAEQAFLSVEKAIVLRLPWLMNPKGDNIFTRVSTRLVSGDSLAVSDICRGCPTTVDDVRRVVTAMILQIFCGAENWGIFHLHTTDSCSEAEFADYVARLLEKEGHATGAIDILRNQEYRLIPGCGLLQGSRCMNNFGIQLRTWRQGLKQLVKVWLEAQEPRASAETKALE